MLEKTAKLHQWSKKSPRLVAADRGRSETKTGMDLITTLAPPKRQARLRALVEIIDGELRIFPIANCESEEIAILDGLRFIREEFRQ